MNSGSYLALALAIFFELVGMIFLHLSHQFTRLWPSVFSVASFGLAAYFLSMALKTIPVGIAYATWSGIGIALITALGFLIFKQKMDLPALIGILMITVGAVLITGFSQSRFH